MPSMPVGLWGDDDGSRYHGAYFDHYPGIWRFGDWIRFTERGSCVLTGRSDATLNRGGVRLGTGEFYSVVEGLEQVVDSLVVHLEDAEGGAGELILFVVPAEGTELPKLIAGVNTAILLSSSFTMHWALESAKSGNRFGLQAGIFTTFGLGATFLFIQINEYVHIGFAPQDTAQGSVFYGLTGLHGAHVAVGLTLLAMTTVRAFRGHFTPEQHRGVEVPGIYWHFVDVMWIIVFTTVYIL